MKKWFNYFVYVSIIFLIFALIKADYLVVPFIYKTSLIILSILFVCLGFVFDALSWQMSLRRYGYNQVQIKSCISSIGLSVFGKYVPGKIWVIIGRSAYISKMYDVSETETASISMNAQFISLWTGLLIGSLGYLIVGFVKSWAILILSLFIVLSFVLFSRLTHDFLSFLIEKIFKRKIQIPSLSMIKVIKVLPWFVLTWLFWCFGFFMLAQGLSPDVIKIPIGFIFALAATFGILAIIVPGGVGVREGILAVMLIMAGLNEPLAISISVTSRLWFLIGESFVFLLGLSLQNINKNIKTKKIK